MKNIFVLGSLNMDMSIHTNSIPNNGETTYGYNFFTNTGGKGANHAVSAAKQGAKTYLIGAVGKDMFGIQLINSVREYGVNIHNIHVVDDATGCATIILKAADNRKILSAGANFKISPRFIDSGLNDAKKDDILICDLGINSPAVGYGIIKAKEKKMKVILNASPAVEFPHEILSDVDILIINEVECRALFEISEISIQTLKNLFDGILIVTVGSKGLFFVKDKEVKYYKALDVRVVDTTSAKDAFIGAFASQLDNGYDYAIKYATVCAGLTCMKEGSCQSIPSKGEVEEKLAELISNE